MLSAKEKLMKKISSNDPLKQKGTELTRNLSVSKLLDTMEITKSHIYFWTDKTPFSNFFYNPFNYKGYNLKFSEQGFMLEKALLFANKSNNFNKEAIEKILKASSPNQAKYAGREVKGYIDSEWDKVRYSKMVEVLKEKFNNSLLKETLLSTEERTLVEASPYDKIWGVGLSEKDPLIFNESNWKGKNLLGKALMEVRYFYKKEK